MACASTFKRQRWMTLTVMSGHSFAERGFIPMLSWPFAMLRCASCLLQLSNAEVQVTACNMRAAGCTTKSAMANCLQNFMLFWTKRLNAPIKSLARILNPARDAFQWLKMHSIFICRSNARSLNAVLLSSFGVGVYFGGRLRSHSVQSRILLHVAVGKLLLLLHLGFSVLVYPHRLHNWCQEETEARRIVQAMEHDAGFDAAILESLQEHDPDDFVWHRIDEVRQPSEVIYDVRADNLMFMRGELRQGFRSELARNSAKRSAFTKSMEDRDVKRPKHSADAAEKRSHRYGE